VTTDFLVRQAEQTELAVLPAIQLAAGALFRDVGMPEIADNPLPSADFYEDFHRQGRLWVAAGEDGPVGFVVVKLIDGCAHIEQVSVIPDHSRRGIGRSLVEQVCQWASAHDLTAVTLSTFRSVPWNAAYYAHLGFRELSAGELTPGLQAVLREEAEFGLDMTDRVCMRREVDAGC
jgi:GNAT superfamily N-acetyltransferase